MTTGEEDVVLYMRRHGFVSSFMIFIGFQGYVPRSCDDGLPPLDPYVEVDTEFLDDPTPMGNGHAKKPPSPHIARCVPDKTGDQSPVCTRCARRFVQWAELEDHKMKCLQY